jgi:hypothetical protein
MAEPTTVTALSSPSTTRLTCDGCMPTMSQSAKVRRLSSTRVRTVEESTMTRLTTEMVRAMLATDSRPSCT